MKMKWGWNSRLEIMAAKGSCGAPVLKGEEIKTVSIELELAKEKIQRGEPFCTSPLEIGAFVLQALSLNTA